jgi:type II secretory pathway pseudopilin PulG
MKKHKHQKGSALVYILIAIALLALLTTTFMDSSSQQTTSQNTFNTVTELNSQIGFIRSAIQECVLTYPEGADDLAGTSNVPYPINPDSAYFTAPAAPAANRNVSNIRCPGNDQGHVKSHGAVFAGNSGKFLPPAPKLFNDWVYYNGVDGVFFYTSTNKTDAFLTTALTKLDDQYSECEADVINNSASGSTLDITSAGASGPNCAANSYCFRVWVIAQTSNIYPGDTPVADEAACP